MVIACTMTCKIENWLDMTSNENLLYLRLVWVWLHVYPILMSPSSHQVDSVIYFKYQTLGQRTNMAVTRMMTCKIGLIQYHMKTFYTYTCLILAVCISHINMSPPTHPVANVV